MTPAVPRSAPFLRLRVAALAFACLPGAAHIAAASTDRAGVQVRGSGARPQLVFACELADAPLQSLFSGGAVISELKDLDAGVALALVDLSPARAEVVRSLNQAGVPVIEWLVLPKGQGYYVNAGNAPQAAARFAAAEKWTAENRLRWSAVGLDIEPSLTDFPVAGQASSRSLLPMLIRRYFDRGSVARARKAYAELIHRIQADGYFVQTYQMPFLADERKAHSTLIERLFGIVDVRGNQEVLMLYSSFSRGAGSAFVWKYGAEAQAIAVGVTSGGLQPDSRVIPLNWNQFSSDLLVASHFTRVVGVYSLEGCVQQGFLVRLKNLDWSAPVNLSAASIAQVTRFRRLVQTGLWIGSRLPYIFGAILAGAIWLIWRRRRGRSGPRLAAMTPPSS